MSISIRRVSLLTLSLALLVVPASAQAKTSKARYKQLAQQVNSTHQQWVALRGPAVNAARTAGAQVSDQCLPAFEAAGKLGNNIDGTRQWLSLGYMAVQNGATNQLIDPLRDQVFEDMTSARIGWKNTEGWYRLSTLMSGFYMSPDELCSVAERWQAESFAWNKRPPEIRRLETVVWSTPPQGTFVRMQRVAKRLRKSGATQAALNNWDAAYSVEIPGSENEAVNKALFPEGTGTVEPAALRGR